MRNTLVDSMYHIKNAQRSKWTSVRVARSRLIVDILVVLRSEGFIRGFFMGEDFILIYLKYYNGRPLINNLKLISKPSNKVYYDVATLINKDKSKGKGFFILSTRLGILTTEQAIKQNCGGEVICYFF
jgi:small subunit ribosomal protein S8